MATEAIAISEHGEIEQYQAIPTAVIKARINAIQHLMQDVLKKDVDYGQIPGMSKDTPPSLFKPGSEQILAMFQMAVEPIVEDLSSDDCYRFRVQVRITNAVTRQFLGAGIGECSSNETKYKWRKTWIQEEFDTTPEDRRRIKFSRYKSNGGAWVDKKEMQVRQEPADLANTILKMAKKRAQIDATLTVTGASSMFSQDLEDMPEEARRATASTSFDDGEPLPDEPGEIKTATRKAAPTESKGAQPRAVNPGAGPKVGTEAGVTAGASVPAPKGEPISPTDVFPPANGGTKAPPSREEGSKPAGTGQPSGTPPASTNGVISDAQRRRFFAICKSAGADHTKVKAYAKEKYGIESTNDIPASPAYTYGIYEALVDHVDPQFKFHTDDFPNKTFGAKKGEAAPKPAAQDDDPNW